MIHKYTYGPVPSRRLGASLGIDIIKSKTCTFNCVYCQIGSTICLTVRRRSYTPTAEVLAEITNVLREKKHIDFLTFSGSGEPTLHRQLGSMIKSIKKMTSIPVAVITNCSLIYQPLVQKALTEADVVLPTLCTVNEKTFKQIHRPNPRIGLRRIINGLIKFRRSYSGRIWLEVMFVKGFNDSREEVDKLKKIVDRVKPDRVQLNTVIRPPSEFFARPLTIMELRNIKKRFGRSCEIIADFKTTRFDRRAFRTYDLIMNALQRRPMTVRDIAEVTGLCIKTLNSKLRNLSMKGTIRTVEHHGQKFYVKK